MACCTLLLTHRVHYALQIRRLIGFAGQTSTHHRRQMVVHDASIKTAFVKYTDDSHFIFVAIVGIGFRESASLVYGAGHVAHMELEQLAALGEICRRIR